jgi:hypothetical protein
MYYSKDGKKLLDMIMSEPVNQYWKNNDVPYDYLSFLFKHEIDYEYIKRHFTQSYVDEKTILLMYDWYIDLLFSDEKLEDEHQLIKNSTQYLVKSNISLLINNKRIGGCYISTQPTIEDIYDLYKINKNHMLCHNFCTHVCNSIILNKVPIVMTESTQEYNEFYVNCIINSSDIIDSLKQMYKNKLITKNNVEKIIDAYKTNGFQGLTIKNLNTTIFVEFGIAKYIFESFEKNPLSISDYSSYYYSFTTEEQQKFNKIAVTILDGDLIIKNVLDYDLPLNIINADVKIHKKDTVHLLMSNLYDYNWIHNTNHDYKKLLVKIFEIWCENNKEILNEKKNVFCKIIPPELDDVCKKYFNVVNYLKICSTLAILEYVDYICDQQSIIKSSPCEILTLVGRIETSGVCLSESQKIKMINIINKIDECLVDNINYYNLIETYSSICCDSTELFGNIIHSKMINIIKRQKNIIGICDSKFNKEIVKLFDNINADIKFKRLLLSRFYYKNSLSISNQINEHTVVVNKKYPLSALMDIYDVEGIDAFKKSWKIKYLDSVGNDCGGLSRDYVQECINFLIDASILKLSVDGKSYYISNEAYNVHKDLSKVLGMFFFKTIYHDHISLGITLHPTLILHMCGVLTHKRTFKNKYGYTELSDLLGIEMYELLDFKKYDLMWSNYTDPIKKTSNYASNIINHSDGQFYRIDTCNTVEKTHAYDSRIIYNLRDTSELNTYIGGIFNFNCWNELNKMDLRENMKFVNGFIEMSGKNICGPDNLMMAIRGNIKCDLKSVIDNIHVYIENNNNTIKKIELTSLIMDIMLEFNNENNKEFIKNLLEFWYGSYILPLNAPKSEVGFVTINNILGNNTPVRAQTCFFKLSIPEYVIDDQLINEYKIFKNIQTELINNLSVLKWIIKKRLIESVNGYIVMKKSGHVFNLV